jgi:DNA-binding transcriptional regulator LsrR (DeoR family)
MIARVAQMYYLEGRRQAHIAKHLRISQATVSRMLKKALEEDIVRISIVSPAGTYAELEIALRSSFGLLEAIVVECSEDLDGPIMARIGETAAYFLETTLQTNDIIGVSSWSETILKMVDNIHPMRSRKTKHVVQTLGGMGDPAVQIHANNLTTRLAKLTGAEANLLITPGVAQSREAKLVLLSDTFVRETIDLFQKITLAIIGIGAIEPSHMLARSGNVFSPRELTEIENAGGIGEIGLRFFDANGGFVKTPLDNRVIGVTLEELAQIERVVALAGGKSKTEAIRGALRTGVIDVLITDKFTAKRLVEPENQRVTEAVEIRTSISR